MMNQEEQKMAESLGKLIGEVVNVYAGVVNALRKQPGFDDENFTNEVQAMISTGEFNDFQREILSSFLSESE
jgi:hypothetical protein